MNPGEVMVVIAAGKGKVRVSTIFREVDEPKVYAALKAVGSNITTQDPPDWPTKKRNEYIAELKRLGLAVYVLNNHASHASNASKE